MSLDLLPSFRLVASQETYPAESCDPLGVYAETYWLPRLDPAGYVLARRLVAMRNRGPRPSEQYQMVNVAVLQAALGLPSRSRLLSTLWRVERAGLATVRGGAIVEIRLRWPRLPSDELGALPKIMRLDEPDRWALEHQPVATGYVL